MENNEYVIVQMGPRTWDVCKVNWSIRGVPISDPVKRFHDVNVAADYVVKARERASLKAEAAQLRVAMRREGQSTECKQAAKARLAEIATLLGA